MTANSTPFDPADATCWIAHGRRPEHAALLAAVWTDLPDLPSDVPLAARMARSRARVAALRPFNDAIREEAERERQRANFASIERRVANNAAEPFDLAILHGQAHHGYDWDTSVRYAQARYAAEAGWQPRDFSAPPGQTTPAYAQGFRDGGGRFDDLFDVARRSYAAAAREEILPTAPARPQLARPLPSSWPIPTDTPRPVRWSRRMLIIGTALENGAAMLDMLQSHPGHRELRIIIAAAGHGFQAWNAAPNPEIKQPADQLRALLAGSEHDDLLIVAHGEDLTWIDRHANILPLCRTMERTRNSAIQQRAQFRVWLERGFDAGETIASGHIRWSKMAKGLSGRLGEFVTRYAGPEGPRRHRIIVQLADGVLATGFMTPQGEPLLPEAIISNKAHLRKEMTAMLRRFAAAIPQPGSNDTPPPANEIDKARPESLVP
ncbi:hypothetical protein [Sphingobium cupriresistens]|uniref:hypothetical protein n=1 Tax=Sphingobium cupriresistens TaxID=1132417 RepID=UPI001A925B73|nr:hypothetical protein [Sphingobium cupriresistens]